jgi:two-component system LytT family response regulator
MIWVMPQEPKLNLISLTNMSDKTIRALLIDDETAALENLQAKLNEFCVGVEIVGMATSALDGIKKVNELKPELIFLDVEMPHGNGFDVLQAINTEEVQVIFVTAFDHYAIKAIRFSAVDYLLKPINIDELIDAVDRAKGDSTGAQPQNKYEVLLENFKKTAPTKLVLPHVEGYSYVDTEEMLYIKANGSYSEIYLKTGKRHIVSKLIKEYEELLSGHGFLRVHNSYLINLRLVKEYSKKQGHLVVMSNDAEVPISKARKELFLSRMKAL